MSAQERYIGGKTGGIPDRIFQPGIKEVFQGASGTLLTASTTKEEISITDSVNKKLCFHTRFDRKTSLIRFTINNKGWEGDLTKRHPDIYPHELFKRGKTYMEEQNGPIEGLSTTWLGTGSLTDNYQQYLDYLSSFKEVTPELQKRAAQKTWEGIQATNAGFTNVDKISSSVIAGRPVVSVIFYRPQK